MKARVMLFCGALLAAMVGVGSDSYAANPDGYKNIKLGITQKELEKKHPCSLTFEKSDDAGRHIQAKCEDFPFNGSKTEAIFDLIDGKLLRIYFRGGDSLTDFESIAKNIVGKYGKATFDLTYDINSFAEGRRDEIEMIWHPGIILRMWRFPRIQLVTVSYQDAKYEALRVAVRK